MNNKALFEGEKASKSAIRDLVIIGVLKILTALTTGMTVMLADAISTFADILGVFGSYIGLHLSRKGETKNFNYGYYKVETFMALLVSLGIVFFGIVVIREGFQTLFNPAAGQNRPFAITVTILAIFQSYRIGKKLQTAADNTNSISLAANARDKRTDIFAGIAVLLSIIANYQGVPYFEGIITILISIAILKVGFQSAKESLFFLLDYWNDPLLILGVKKIIHAEHDLIKQIKKIRLRRAGTFIFGEAFVEINPFSGIQDLRETLNIVESKIKKLNPYIKDFSIYPHIPEVRSFKIALPVDKAGGLKSEIAQTLRQTKAYLFVSIRNNKIRNFYLRKINPRHRKTLELASFLKKEKINILIDNNLHSLLYYNLRRTHHILIYPEFSDVKRADKVLELLMIDT